MRRARCSAPTRPMSCSARRSPPQAVLKARAEGLPHPAFRHPRPAAGRAALPERAGDRHLRTAECADAAGALLTASDVVGLDLDADLVILSACNSGGPGGTTAGESLSGLARAFFYAGARSLLVTHWSVNDQVAAYPGRRYAAPDAGRTRTSASPARCGDAQLAMLADAGKGLPAEIAHPFFWAPFAVIGEGGERRAGASAETPVSPRRLGRSISSALARDGKRHGRPSRPSASTRSSGRLAAAPWARFTRAGTRSSHVAWRSRPCACPTPPIRKPQEELARFRREAQAAGRLSHPNIVGVFDYGETAELAYIVMEFVDGPPLKDVAGQARAVRAGGHSRAIMEDLLAGLQFSHERGVVHRDIKPANVMLTSSGQAKIADFGIARIESSSMTQAGTVLGTPAYMSPEQFMGQVVDARTDIYSVGRAALPVADRRAAVRGRHCRRSCTRR